MGSVGASDFFESDSIHDKKKRIGMIMAGEDREKDPLVFAFAFWMGDEDGL